MAQNSISYLKTKDAFRTHGWAFLCATIALFVINMVSGGGWWFHFVPLIWGVVLMVHFMVVKTLSVDDGWADERANKLRSSSYDLGHILQIADTYNEEEENSSPEKKKPAETR
jgi:hypothetical protein